MKGEAVRRNRMSSLIVISVFWWAGVGDRDVPMAKVRICGGWHTDFSETFCLTAAHEERIPLSYFTVG